LNGLFIPRVLVETKSLKHEEIPGKEGVSFILFIA